MPVATHPDSARHRRLTLRRRADLVIVAQSQRGQMVWAVKDPLALRYFHLNEEEYWILEHLDGQTSLDRLERGFTARFSPRRISVAELQSSLGRLHQSGLVVADAAGQSVELLRRASDERAQRIRRFLSNPLAMRFRGIDPERLLSWIERFLGGVFSPACLIAASVLVAAALTLVATRFAELVARLPDQSAFLSPANLVWLAIALAAVKVLHELGHALVCRRLGGECSEIGVMLLVFTPCLYCNVSDAWMLSGKWQRAAVGAAGIAVELVVAACCTFLWWWSNPGLVNSILLNVMAVCTINTLVINGNPLLRYDGYYVLSDLIEIPNLASRAAARVRSLACRWVLGIETQPSGDSRMVGAVLALYGVASAVYRWMVVFGILWFVYKALQPQRLEAIAGVLAWGVAAGLVVSVGGQVTRFFGNPYQRRQVKAPRAILGLAVAAGAVVAVLIVPLPHRVACPALVEAAGARRVYATMAGTLAKAALEGSPVSRGDEIARLENSQLDHAIASLQGQCEVQRLHVENLKRRQVRDDSAAGQLPPAEELLADLEERLQRRQEERARLVVRAPISGTILPPRRREAPVVPGALPQWSGTPLAPANVGCTIDTGTLLCLVGDPGQFEALLVIDQANVDAIAPGQTMHLRLDQSPGTPLTGKIASISDLDLDAVPPELVARGELAIRSDSAGRARPVTALYQARVRLDPPGRRLRIGETGTAHIVADSRSLGNRLLRALNRTFNLDLPVE